MFYLFSSVFMTERVFGLHLPKKKENAVLFVNGDCNGTIDMHFILIVYKYEYIMNKIPIS